MKAAGGFGPPHCGFADRSLNHLGTPPQSQLVQLAELAEIGEARSMSAREAFLKSQDDARASKPRRLARGGRDKSTSERRHFACGDGSFGYTSRDFFRVERLLS